MKNVLIIAPHPDDETLGCGGTLLKHKKILNDNVFCIFVTNGNKYQEKQVPIVAKKYDFNEFFQLNFQETKLDTVPLEDLISNISNIVKKIEPDILYLPNRSDVHSDHRVVFNASIAASKIFRLPSLSKILMYEVISETDFSPALQENAFSPQVFVDITEFFELKLEIFRSYHSEILPEPMVRSFSSIEALARYRGSQINTKYAESFMLIKEVL